MRPEEAIFNEVATELNTLLSSARPELESSRIEISARSRDPKDYLVWEAWFTKSWPGPSAQEQARVTVRISFMEPDPGQQGLNGSLWVAAEIFQIGQPSRIRETTENKISQDELRSSGIGNIVFEKIGWGHDLLTLPKNWR